MGIRRDEGQMLPQWSLRSLLELSGLVTFTVAVVSAFPKYFGWLGYPLIVFLPSIVIFFLAAGLSKFRERTVAIVLAGSLIGAVLSPVIVEILHVQLGMIHLGNRDALNSWVGGLVTYGVVAGTFSIAAVLIDVLVQRYSTVRSRQAIGDD